MKKNFTGAFRRMDKKIRWLFVFSLVAFACFMGILYQQKSSQEATRLGIYNTYSAIKKLEKISALVVETESAARGFLLTKDPEWKQTLAQLHKQVLDSVREIKQLSGDTDTEKQHIRSLENLVRRKIDLQASTVRAEVLTPVLLEKTRSGGEAAQVTNAIRELLAVMIQEEERLLSLRVAKNEKDYNTGVMLALFGGIFAFILVIVILVQLNADISLRRKAEGNLILSESKYRNLIENAGVVMFTADIEGKITFTNSHVLHLTGYTADELIGKHFTILIDPGWVERVVVFYGNQFVKRIPATTMHFLTRSRSGEAIWVEQFAQLLFEKENIVGFQCMVRDITEKKMIEYELGKSELKRKENEYRLSSIIDNTTALIFIKDLQGRYIMVNKRFKKVFGLTDEMVINKTDYDFNSTEKADHYKLLDEQVITTLQPIESEELIETAEGKMNLLLVKFPLLDDKQKAFGISGIATDITERTQSRLQLESALKRAEEAKELQEQFLANMSHEIRTPMNGIHGMTTLLLETPLNNEQKEFASMIQRSLNNLTAIVNDILDISNIKAGKLTLEKIQFHVHDQMEIIRNQFAHDVARKKLSFDLRIERDVPASLVGDPYRLRQVLVSLVGNAIKFTNAGRISVHVCTKEKTAKTIFLSFTVQDTGIGIPADKLQTIFKSFAQATMDISRGYGGAGLGLAISKGLVEILGGSISAESEAGRGSVFSFDIPYELPLSIEGDEAGVVVNGRLYGKRFLVVEDNEVNQKLIGSVLKKVGGINDIASNGKEAIEYFKKGREYDLVIMDLQMPVMDGYETATYIRQQLKLDIPIIALTATALKGDQEKCRQVGMNDFMLKPFDFNDLYRRLVNLLFQEENNAFVPAEPIQENKKLYDLSLLEELDDKESLLDVISLFLENTPVEVMSLPALAQDRNWTELFKLAHKIKGAVAILQATAIAQLLGSIELNAKEEKNLDQIADQVAALVPMFDEMRASLEKEHAALTRELAASK
jgi:PAS domain S-box-containing protein